MAISKFGAFVPAKNFFSNIFDRTNGVAALTPLLYTNQLVDVINKIERSSVLQQKQPFSINNTSLGTPPIITSLYNSVSSACQPCGTIIVNPGPCSNFYSCTGVKPTPDTPAPTTTVKIILTLSPSEPATTQLSFGNPTTAGDIISVVKISEIEYDVTVINALTGILSENSLDNVFFEVNLFYNVDILFPDQK